MFDHVRPLVAPLDPEILDRDPSSICLVDSALRIVFVNQAWYAFAREGGASWRTEGEWGVGSHMLDAISPDLAGFYARLFADAARSEVPIEHSYDCSTPTQLRRYRVRLLPCRDGHVLAIHSRVDEAPAPSDTAPSDLQYRAADGFITQCSHCRRVRRVGSSPPQWDWVAAYVANVPEHTSHGLCAVCLDYYYPP